MKDEPSGGRRRRGGPGVAWALVVALSSLLLVAGAAPSPAAQTLPNAEVADAVRFRAEFGLNSDPAAVAAISSTAADPASWKYGVALTPSESALMNRRDEIQANLEPLRTYGQTNADAFGGIWLTYPSGGDLASALTLNVNLTTVGMSHAHAVERLVPEGATLVIHEVDFTERALGAIHPEIGNDREFFSALGTELYSMETLVPENVVEVSVSTLDDRIESAVRDRFGPMVRVRAGTPVQADACSRLDCGPPWKGSLKIARPGPAYCTSGFVVRKASGSSYVYALWTAGHCGSGTWKLAHPTGVVIGPTSAVYWHDGIFADVQVIPIASSVKSNVILDDIYGCTNCSKRIVTTQQGHNADEYGDTVCNDGWASGKRCGTIRSTDYSFVYQGNTVYHFRRATYTRKPGDSGGPVWTTAGSAAAGSHTHFVTIPSGGTEYAVYSHVYWMTQYSGYSVNPTP